MASAFQRSEYEAPLNFCWRVGMELGLGQSSELPRLPSEYRLGPWERARLDELAEVEYRSYLGSEDARCFPDALSTVDRCWNSLSEALKPKRFDPERSLFLLRGEQLCGHLLAWCLDHRVGFIHDVAILPEHRGGTGRAMLLECLNRYQRAGFRRVGLSVTTANSRALHLYERLGFRDSSWWIELVPRGHE
jgi:ribosomal protein S18 acetylase RimI-like enzyme